MYIHNQSTFTDGEKIILAGLVAPDPRPQGLTGLMAGTRVETEFGWRAVEALTPGDRLFTYDGGLRRVQHVERTFFDFECTNVLPDGLVLVPGGMLNNCAEMLVLPDQPLMIESLMAQRMFGVANVLLPAAALVGYLGVRRTRPGAEGQALTLVFEDEETVWANGGVLFHCPGQRGENSDYFTRLDGTRADAMAALLDQEWRQNMAA